MTGSMSHSGVPSRRGVLVAGAAGAGLSLVGGVGAAGPAAAATSGPLRAHYAKSVGKVFSATQGRRTRKVRLVAIRDLVATSARQRPYCFTLVFAPVSGGRLPDGIYTFTRRRVRTHRLFLSEIGDARSVQVVVNRPV